MTLPAPNLDDRRFQDLVDDAKRFVQQRCPEWSDHNVSDPGVTLIETFAMVTDQLLYRLNRVPDRMYIRFLELLGLQLFPPAAARVPVTFWLAAPREDTVRVPRETEVATERSSVDPDEPDRDDAGEPVVFATEGELAIVPCSLSWIATAPADGAVTDRTDQLGVEEPFPAFRASPAYDDALLIGLSNPVPSCAVAVRFSCRVEGVGVDPRHPPLVWEAWTGRSWAECEVDRDDTGGLNRPGDIVLHVPATHTASIIARRKAGWLRCRVVPPVDGQPFYTVSPRIRGASAFTIGGTVSARYAEAIRDETVGLSEGVPGQRFALTRRPVVDADDDVVVEVAGGGGWERWSRVEHFAESDEHDRHFVLDAAAGEIAFGPGVREPDGSVRQYGAVPPKAAPIRVPRYRTGGGRRGNVARGTVRSMRSSLPFVARIENRKPGMGGVDGESVDNAKRRAPLELRTRNRAVTLRDYEYLARAAARQVARVHCQTGADSGSAVVRVLLVPEAESDEAWRLEFEALQPDDEVLQRVAAYLDERRVLGARLIVEPPRYRGVTVVAHLHGRPGVDSNRVRAQAVTALNRYLHPLVGGPGGDGWPFGRPVQVGELNSVLQAVSGVELVDELRLYPADPITGERDMQVQRLDLPANALVYSFHHQIRVSS